MLPFMSSDDIRVSRTYGGMPMLLASRRFRLLVVTSFVVLVGIGLGAQIGNWLATTELPSAQIALEVREMPYQVVTRTYRRLAREYELTVPAKNLEPNFEPIAVARSWDFVAEVETRLNQGVGAPRHEQEDLELGMQKSTLPNSAPPPPLRLGGMPQWMVNAVPPPITRGRPMIAIVMDDLGLSPKRVRRTIALPGPITLAFLPYARNLRKLAKEGRAAGHELIIHMNMEPKDHDIDPGPNALLTSMDPMEIRERLLWALNQFDGYIGVSNHMGSRFTEWPNGMEVVIRALKRRGLLYFDSLTSTKSVGLTLARAHGTAYASRDVFLDHERFAKAVAWQLAQTEQIARRRGYAIAIGHPYDVTFDVLENWLPDAEARGFVMVPLSTIVRRQRGEG